MKTKTTTKKRTTKITTKSKTSTKRPTKRKRGLGEADNSSAVASVVSTNKTAVKLAVGAIAAGALFFIGKKIISSIKKGKEENEFIDAMASMPIDNANLTITKPQATQLANSLLAAMDRFGTDEDTINRIFNDNIKTKDDFLLVQRAFGQKGYNQTTGRRNDSHSKLSLVSWIRAETSGKTLRNVETKLADWGILAGI